MKRGEPLRHDPQRAAARKAHRLARRAQDAASGLQRAPEGDAAQDGLAAREGRQERAQEPRSTDRRTPEERAEALGWRLTVIATGCVMCQHRPPTARVRVDHAHDGRVLQAHHVIAQRHLKRAGLAALLWRPENGMCLCRYHHARHEVAIERVPLLLVRPESVGFAQGVGLAWVLDREYAQ